MNEGSSDGTGSLWRSKCRSPTQVDPTPNKLVKIIMMTIAAKPQSVLHTLRSHKHKTYLYSAMVSVRCSIADRHVKFFFLLRIVNNGLCLLCTMKCMFLPQNARKCAWRPGFAASPRAYSAPIGSQAGLQGRETKRMEGRNWKGRGWRAEGEWKEGRWKDERCEIMRTLLDMESLWRVWTIHTVKSIRRWWKGVFSAVFELYNNNNSGNSNNNSYDNTNYIIVSAQVQLLNLTDLRWELAYR